MKQIHLYTGYYSSLAIKKTKKGGKKNNEKGKKEKVV